MPSNRRPARVRPAPNNVPAKRSAGIVLHRMREGIPQVFLVHPGGPLWARKDAGAWSIPKGEFEPGEDPRTVALREFQEETGFALEPALPAGATFIELPPRRQPGGKTVYAWAVAADCDARFIESNTFTMEWPPRSGRQQAFPEVDRADWFSLSEARLKIMTGQLPFLDDVARLAGSAERKP
jgi:predicted NUDIX family NTP pyrophosphohydrolase